MKLPKIIALPLPNLCENTARFFYAIAPKSKSLPGRVYINRLLEFKSPGKTRPYIFTNYQLPITSSSPQYEKYANASVHSMLFSRLLLRL